ncbi:MAG TPA: D-glycero-beta-D-manno-heptose 1-phosphate adenylyltransferase [Vicinamibacterales bacterium]|nr:D-glycero-beta-D-manno-heptose 1-phosphate adenylyltransferase [Vicinamibacterales bacterium]
MGVFLSSENAAAWVQELRARGLKIVFTNGVFDLLHPGHVRYLSRARELGDALIVAVNSDRSARALDKGRDRPLNPETERAEVLAALACVDATVIFDEDTPHDIVNALEPDVLVKGADWAEGAIVGADIVEARGGTVVRIPLAEGYSTTAIIQRILDRGRG